MDLGSNEALIYFWIMLGTCPLILAHRMALLLDKIKEPLRIAWNGLRTTPIYSKWPWGLVLRTLGRLRKRLENERSTNGAQIEV